MPAEPLDLAFLQEPQQARLALERHVADFVEKQRAAVRGLDAADLALVRARERTALVAEQFGLQQRRRDGRAVHGDERCVGTRRLPVDRRRRQFLAGAGFAGDEHGRLGVRDLADRREQPAHRAARADHRAAGRRRLRGRVAVREFQHPVRMADEIADRRVGRRIAHVVEAAVADQARDRDVAQLLAVGERDPADPRVTQQYLERRDVRRREAVEIDDARMRAVRLDEIQRVRDGFGAPYVPAARREHIDERGIVLLRQVDERPRRRDGMVPDRDERQRAHQPFDIPRARHAQLTAMVHDRLAA